MAATFSFDSAVVVVDPTDATGIFVNGHEGLSMVQIDDQVVVVLFDAAPGGGDPWNVDSPEGLTPDLGIQSGGVD